MDYTFKSPETEQEWQAYFDLRWRILRAPWQQPRGSEQDEMEDLGYHIMALHADCKIIGTGRLHRINAQRCQIRYMAVTPQYQSMGIGSGLLSRLELTACRWHCKEIILNARTDVLEFYLTHGYEVVGDGPLLFGQLPHKHMRKLL